MDKNQGYAILKAVMLENGRGFALGEHPTAPSRYVTWACYDDKDGQRQYEWRSEERRGTGFCRPGAGLSAYL